jgi:hypothetical protein
MVLFQETYAKSLIAASHRGDMLMHVSILATTNTRTCMEKDTRQEGREGQQQGDSGNRGGQRAE